MAGKLKLNTVQLAVLRQGNLRLACDRCTGKALVARGFAFEAVGGVFYITGAGQRRAQRAADIEVHRDGHPFDQSLMEDLPS